MLTLTNIQKTFAPGTVNEKKALCGIDLHLDAGDFVTILGSNGAGKSTLFGAIAGSFLPDTGSVVLDGQDITSLPDYKRSKFIVREVTSPVKLFNKPNHLISRQGVSSRQCTFLRLQ